jgi:hypothetical protein
MFEVIFSTDFSSFTDFYPMDSDSESSFDGFESVDSDSIVTSPVSFNESDITVSSVHTSDLSDFSNDSDDDVGPDTDWTQTLHDVTVDDFQENSGPRHSLPQDASPIDFFSAYV